MSKRGPNKAEILFMLRLARGWKLSPVTRTEDRIRQWCRKNGYVSYLHGWYLTEKGAAFIRQRDRVAEAELASRSSRE